MLVLLIALLLLGKPLYNLFWRGLEGLGVRDAKRRWARQSRWIKVLPLVAAIVLALLIVWGRGTQPSLSLVILIGIILALYVVPPRVRQYVIPVTVLAIAVLYPILIAENWLWAGSVPIITNPPSMDAMVIVTVYVMMALGLNMVVGYAGLLDLGYVAFFAIGAYCAAWFASPHFARPDINTGLPSIDINFGAVGVFEGSAASTSRSGSCCSSAPRSRLSPACSSGCRRCGYAATISPSSRSASARWWPRWRATATSCSWASTSRTARRASTPSTRRDSDPGLHENLGLPDIFRDSLGWWVSGTFDPVGDVVDLMYWGAIALVLITLFCSIRLRDSRLGRAWIAIREDETAAAAMGIPLMRTKTWSYASGAFFGGVAGVWFASFQQAVFPDTFNFNVSVFILCMVILGGMGNVWGVIAGASFLAYLNTEGLAEFGGWMNENLLRCGGGQEAGKVISDGCVDVPAVSFGIYGIILVVVMLVRPYGLFPEARRKQEFEVGVRDEPLMDVRGAPEE